MPPHDLINAPDGRTWYETAIAEAEKRGKLQEEMCNAVTAERERCAKIVDVEVAEYQRQIDAHNRKKSRQPEHGWMLHGKWSASVNAAALIRKGD